MSVNWEYFRDLSYYNFWCVRPVTDKDFNSLNNFHVTSYRDATLLCNLLNNLDISQDKLNIKEENTEDLDLGYDNKEEDESV